MIKVVPFAPLSTLQSSVLIVLLTWLDEFY